jgi:prepilin-type N-terminal cleavage/methylation domain-containing protein
MRKKGFTLVEIMIVVAIIGIIIAIAVPAFLRARENSRGRACQENLQKIDGAKEQYALEFKLSNGSTIAYPDDLLLPPAATTGEGYLKKEPQCPSSGSYTANAIGTDATCSVGDNGAFEDHILP